MGSYAYRRELTRDELLPALGLGVGLGLGVAVVTAYVTQILLRRTPLRPADESRPRRLAESGDPGYGERLLDSRFRGNDVGRGNDGGRWNDEARGTDGGHVG